MCPETATKDPCGSGIDAKLSTKNDYKKTKGKQC